MPWSPSPRNAQPSGFPACCPSPPQPGTGPPGRTQRAGLGFTVQVAAGGGRCGPETPACSPVSPVGPSLAREGAHASCTRSGVVEGSPREGKRGPGGHGRDGAHPGCPDGLSQPCGRGPTAQHTGPEFPLSFEGLKIHVSAPATAGGTHPSPPAPPGSWTGCSATAASTAARTQHPARTGHITHPGLTSPLFGLLLHHLRFLIAFFPPCN